MYSGPIGVYVAGRIPSKNLQGVDKKVKFSDEYLLVFEGSTSIMEGVGVKPSLSISMGLLLYSTSGRTVMPIRFRIPLLTLYCL